jgi:dihydroorotate dehydrogenase
VQDAQQAAVIVKLTPNITDVRAPARAAKAGGADAVSLINTINSITHLDLDQMVAFRSWAAVPARTAATAVLP